jgi:Icc-related predicted phosphoesterase
MGLKITFISDTHTYMYDSRYKELMLPEGDIICFSGDLMTSGHNEGELIHFLKWFSKQPFKCKIFIAGNHDRYLENYPSIANDIISEYKNKGVVYLNNSSFEYEGIKFYGTPHQPYFCDWAFNVPDCEKLMNIYQQIPDDTDILLTHCPPFGILDQSHQPNYSNLTGEKNLGSKELREVLDDLSNGTPLDFDERYANLTQGSFAQSYSFNEKLEIQYRFTSTKSYFQFLLINFLNSNPNVSRCLCCGQFFIPRTRKKTLYCDRIISEGKACKEVAPAIKHQMAVDTDSVLRIYERTKQKMYKRYERATWTIEELPKGISFDEYLDWREAASVARDKYIKGEMSAEEALKVIQVND